MNILVLLAGVADNRFPLHGVALAEDGSVVETEPARMVLSPFDEGALELALKLRDKNSKCNVEVLVLGAGATRICCVPSPHSSLIVCVSWTCLLAVCGTPNSLPRS